ncbi:30S ribosomal protein S17 [Thermithiobacillus plumbiphilus]|uniref:Small ribosomal subunit protein uS17 n=1 Tax=Thermithiobacillus plumbiphilus TaxID=1729899 RepID=A0ABU9DAE5_9PROT
MATETGNRTVVGKVVSNKMDQTIVVLIERQIQHPIYKKYIRRSNKIHAHDEGNLCQEGDEVMVEACRPLSKTKFWRLVKVLNKAT